MEIMSKRIMGLVQIILKIFSFFFLFFKICFPKRSDPGESLDSEWWDWSTRVFIGRIRFPSASKTQGIKLAQIDDIHASCHSDCKFTKK